MVVVQRTDMDNETEFRSLAPVGFPDYFVSNEGDIWSRKTKSILSGYEDDRGYTRVNLTDPDGKVKAKTVHRLVAKSFIPNPDNLPQVDHISGDKADNTTENLRWCSNLQNAQYAMQTGCMPHAVFKSDDVVRGICERLQNGESVASIRKDTGFSTDAIMRIRLGDNWKHISKDYTFPETKKQNYPPQDTIETMCKMILDGTPAKTICETLNVRRETVQRTQVGRIHKKIMESVKENYQKDMPTY